MSLYDLSNSTYANEQSSIDRKQASLEIDITKISSSVLSRLVSEVKNEDVLGVNGSYDRVHNRHNR